MHLHHVFSPSLSMPGFHVHIFTSCLYYLPFFSFPSFDIYPSPAVIFSVFLLLPFTPASSQPFPPTFLRLSSVFLSFFLHPCPVPFLLLSSLPHSSFPTFSPPSPSSSPRLHSVHASSSSLTPCSPPHSSISLGRPQTSVLPCSRSSPPSLLRDQGLEGSHYVNFW